MMTAKQLQACFKCSWIDEQCIRKCIQPEIGAIANNPDYRCVWPQNEESIFQAFSIIDRFPRLVIMGQEPYPDERATGLAFEVISEKHDHAKSSLKSLCRSMECSESWFDIRKWAADNDILLVNAALSCSGLSDCKNKQYRIWRPFWSVMIRILIHSRTITVLSLGRKSESLFKNYKSQLGKRFFYSPHPLDRHNGFNMTKSAWKKIQKLSGIKLPTPFTDERSNLSEGKKEQ